MVDLVLVIVCLLLCSCGEFRGKKNSKSVDDIQAPTAIGHTPAPMVIRNIPLGSFIVCSSSGWECRFPERIIDLKVYEKTVEYTVNYDYECSGIYEVGVRSAVDVELFNERGKARVVKVRGNGPLVFFDNKPMWTMRYPLPDNCDIHVSSVEVHSLE